MGSMTQLLDTGDRVSYSDWKQAKLSKEEEFDLNGMMSNQALALADDLYAHRKPSEGAFPATAMHQTFRRSGFV